MWNGPVESKLLLHLQQVTISLYNIRSHWGLYVGEWKPYTQQRVFCLFVLGVFWADYSIFRPMRFNLTDLQVNKITKTFTCLQHNFLPGMKKMISQHEGLYGFSVYNYHMSTYTHRTFGQIFQNCAFCVRIFSSYLFQRLYNKHRYIYKTNFSLILKAYRQNPTVGYAIDFKLLTYSKDEKPL